MQFRRIALYALVISSTAIALAQRSGGQTKPGNTILDAKPNLCKEGCEFSDLNAAIRSSTPGGVINVAPGIYASCGIVDKPLQLIGLKDETGKRAHLAGAVCDGKGALVLRADDIVIQGFEISDIIV